MKGAKIKVRTQGWFFLKKKNGFTVIELILALGLTVIIGVSLFTVYNNAVRADVQSRRLYESMIRGYMILKSIEDDVSSVTDYRYHSSGQGNDELIFYGEEGQLSFVKESDKGLQWVQYTTKDADRTVVHTTVIGQRLKRNQDQVLESQSAEGQNPQMFIRRQAQFLGGPDAVFDPANDEVLAGHLMGHGLSFSYGRVSRQGIVWSEKWNDSSLPAVIKVDLKIPWEGQSRSFDLSKVIVLPASL